MIMVLIGYLIYTLMGKMTSAAHQIGGREPRDFYILAMGLLLFWVFAGLFLWAHAMDEDEERRAEIKEIPR